MIEYRHSTLTAINYSSAVYDSPASAWIRRAFIQPQAMIHDRYLYNPNTGYTVDRYLDDLLVRYGGIDAVLLWPTYPNIGVDPRNQFDMIRSLPGYPTQVRAMVDRFHARSVRVLLPFNPWDTGQPQLFCSPLDPLRTCTHLLCLCVGTNTSRPSMVEELIDEIALIGADGFNGDTMTGIPRTFFDYATQRYNLTLMMQAEGGLSDKPDAAELPWQLASWGYWDADASLISKYKWLEPRFMLNICNRWARSHTVDLQQAWLNGVGFESWEDVWSIWNQLSPRDAQAVRQVATMSRHLSHLLTSSDLFLPHFPGVVQAGVFGCLFARYEEQQVLYTLVNTGKADVTGVQLEVDNDVGAWTFIDCYHGRILHPNPSPSSSPHSSLTRAPTNATQVTFDIEAGGFGCVLLLPTPHYNASQWSVYLTTMANLTLASLSSYSSTQSWLQQRVTPTTRTSPPTSPPPNMTLITGAKGWWFNVSGIEIEGGDGLGVDVQYDIFGEILPSRHHSLRMDVASFYVDTHPVTRSEYAAYLVASAYKPVDPTNYLRGWSLVSGHFSPPPGTGDRPVTWVTMEEARLYCAWGGKRLIDEWEYQWVAQNGEGYTAYPWGEEWDGTRVPAVVEGGLVDDPVGVEQLSRGANRVGVLDLVGNKWEWTTEVMDDHSRRGILRGGSRYKPQGSMWYFPNAEKGNVHGLYLMMGHGMDRSQFIGFRCVQDMGNAEGGGARIVVE